MKPVDINPSKHIEFNQENNKKGPNFKVCDNVRISKYKNIFANVYFQIGLKTFLWLKKLKALCREYLLLMNFTEKKFLESFTKKKFKKTNQIGFKVE